MIHRRSFARTYPAPSAGPPVISGSLTASADASGSFALTQSPAAGDSLLYYHSNSALNGHITGIFDNVDGATGWVKTGPFNLPADSGSRTYWFKSNVPAGITDITYTRTGSFGDVVHVVYLLDKGDAIVDFRHNYNPWRGGGVEHFHTDPDPDWLNTDPDVFCVGMRRLSANVAGYNPTPGWTERAINVIVPFYSMQELSTASAIVNDRLPCTYAVGGSSTGGVVVVK